MRPGVHQHRGRGGADARSPASRCRSSAPAGRRCSISFAAVGILLSISRETVGTRRPSERCAADRGRAERAGTSTRRWPSPGRFALRPARRSSPGWAASAASRPARAGRRHPAAPARRCARCAAADAIGPPRPRSGPARPVGAPGDGDPRPPPAGGDLHDRRLRRDPDHARRRGACGSRSCMWDGNVVPGRSVRATARLVAAVAVSSAATCAALALPGGRCFETGTPIRDARGHRPGRRPRALRRARRRPPAPRLRRLAGRPPVQRRRRRRARPRLVERVHVVHVTGDAGYAAALAGREGCRRRFAIATGRIPFLRAEMTAGPRRRRPVVGRAGSLHAGRGDRPRPAARRRARTRTPPATSARTPCALVEAGRRPADRGRGLRRRRAAGRGRDPRRSGRPQRDGRRIAGRSAGRPPPPRSPSSSSPRPSTAPFPEAADDRLAGRAASSPDEHRERQAAAFDCARDRHARSSAGSGSRPRATSRWPLHDDPPRRTGRPVRRRPQRLRAARARPVRPVARAAAHPPRTGQRRADRRRRDPRPRDPGPRRGDRDRRADARRGGRRADGPGRDGQPVGRPVGARVRPGDPGHGRRRRVGQRRRPRLDDRGRPRSGAASCRRRQRAPARRRPSSGSTTATAGSSIPADRVAAEVVLGATFQLEPASAAEIKERLEEIKRWRQEHQPLGTPSAGIVVPQPAAGTRPGR